MLALVDPEDADVHRTLAGKEGLDLLAHEEVGRIAEPIPDLQASVDRVVVGQRHEIHAAGLRPTVDLDRRGVAVAHLHEAELLQPGVVAMDVQVSAQGILRKNWTRPGRGPKEPGTAGRLEHEVPRGFWIRDRGWSSFESLPRGVCAPGQWNPGPRFALTHARRLPAIARPRHVHRFEAGSPERVAAPRRPHQGGSG